MLNYFKRYEIAACVVAVAIPVITMYIWSFIAGQNMGFTAAGAAVSVFLLLGGLFLFSRMFTRLGQDKLDALVALYNEGCDPQALVDEGKRIAESAEEPYEDVAAWYLSYYALALEELGRRSEAASIGIKIKAGIEQSEDASAERLSLYCDFIPLVNRLFGPGQVLALANEALALRIDDKMDCSEYRSYLNWARQGAELRVSGDNASLAAFCRQVRENEAQPMRMRVEFAELEAEANIALGQVDAAKECLGFAVEHGGKLACAQRARQRLCSL